MNKLKMSHKLVAAFLIIGLLPAIVVTWIALNKSSNALEKQAYDQLISVREMKKAQVKYYFEEIANQVVTYADDLMIVDAARAFSKAYDSYVSEGDFGPDDIKEMRQEVRNYYTGQYLKVYGEENEGASLSADSLLSGLNDTGIALQYSYIADNANPLGEKHTLDRGAGDFDYHAVHEKYHPHVREFLDKFGYYDIFIVHPETGDIIYSVFKELDYATSLLSGPYADSNFAEAFRMGRTLSKGEFRIVDYKQYTPSYEAPASFIASPIVHEGETHGVLIFQMPIARLNDIMAERSGLGESGESYLVGEDKLMRSDSYLDPVNHSVSASFRNPELGKVDSDATTKAFQGETGETVVIDYNGNPVLSAYTAFAPVEGLNWAILAEIDEVEAFASIASLRNAILVILAVASILVVFAGIAFTHSVTRPIRAIFQGLKGFSNHELWSTQQSFTRIAGDISGATHNITSLSNHLSDASSSQAASLEETSASMEEISSVTQQNAQHAQESSELSAAAQASVEEGNSAMHGMSDVMGKIQSSSEEISGILKIIDDISFQTNILALNAAVEAARAGESGAGFAVVADEVRQLAQRTANAAKDTAKLIDESVKNAQNGVESGKRMTEILKDVEDKVGQASELAKNVSAASFEQTQGITQINGALTQLDHTTQQNAAESQDLTTQATQLAQVVQDLDAIIGLSSSSGGAASQQSAPQTAQKKMVAPSVSANAASAPMEDNFFGDEPANANNDSSFVDITR